MIRARVWATKERNRWDERGYIHNWHYTIYDTGTGRILASDNTGDGYRILEAALEDLAIVRRAISMGIVKGQHTKR
jgi:hypothetical protein